MTFLNKELKIDCSAVVCSDTTLINVCSNLYQELLAKENIVMET